MDYRFLLVLAVVLIASGCASNSSPEASPASETGDSPEPTDADTNTIYLTDSGFQPSEITVEQGETVTWVNNASSSMWVASDQHPTHTEYDGTSLRSGDCDSGEAEFDQCSTGERYSFTFEKTGTWGYHNHEPYVQGGQVVVE